MVRREIEQFMTHLRENEKSPVTVEKYERDVRAFAAFAGERALTRELVLAYKEALTEQYAVASVNSMLAALNGFLQYLGRRDLCVKHLRCQRRIFCEEDRRLTREEYGRLLKAAEGDERLRLILQTICGTGIRVSELRFFTAEAIRSRSVTVRCKSKSRAVLLPEKLRCKLLEYARARGIRSGAIFVTRGGRPMDRSNIWSQMKRLCASARVSEKKVFPHNLRKLFARTFYGIEKDIAKLADILGHSSIDTTRIYIMTTGTEHRKKIERLGLVI